MDVYLKDIVDISFGAIAIMLAFITIIFGWYQFKKQIRISKLEKIIALSNYLVTHYETIFRCYGKLNLFHARNENLAIDHESYKNEVARVKHFIDINVWSEKYYELEMLVKVYKKGELKKELLAFCHFQKDFFEVALYEQWMWREIIWKDSFLSPNQFYEYFNTLERKLVEAIGMSMTFFSPKDIRELSVKLFSHKG
nr:hypothetical protein [uncultured Carboxylicivirga sp.]